MYLVIVEIRVLDESRKVLFPNYSVPNVSPPRLPQLRIIFVEPTFLLARPIQLSVQGLCVCLSFNVCTTHKSRSLFSQDTDSKTLGTIVS